MIREMKKEDSLAIATIHKEALKGDFLPSLGLSVLEIIYQGLLDDKKSFGYVSEKNGRVVGFITGSENTNELFKRIFLKKFVSLLFKVGFILLKNPSILPKLFQTLFYNDKAKTETSAELISIALKTEYRRKNIGKKLIQELIAEFKKRNIKKIKVTVNRSNIGANKFYKKIGFKYETTFTMYGKKMNLYTLEI